MVRLRQVRASIIHKGEAIMIAGMYAEPSFFNIFSYSPTGIIWNGLLLHPIQNKVNQHQKSIRSGCIPSCSTAFGQLSKTDLIFGIICYACRIPIFYDFLSFFCFQAGIKSMGFTFGSFLHFVSGHGHHQFPNCQGSPHKSNRNFERRLVH